MHLPRQLPSSLQCANTATVAWDAVRHHHCCHKKPMFLLKLAHHDLVSHVKRTLQAVSCALERVSSCATLSVAGLTSRCRSGWWPSCSAISPTRRSRSRPCTKLERVSSRLWTAMHSGVKSERG